MDEDQKKLADAHGGIWGEHPDYQVSDWQHEVANDETRSGYWSFVEGRIEQAEFDEEGD